MATLTPYTQGYNDYPNWNPPTYNTDGEYDEYGDGFYEAEADNNSANNGSIGDRERN